MVFPLVVGVEISIGEGLLFQSSLAAAPSSHGAAKLHETCEYIPRRGKAQG
jgi:hypothetical protein